MFAIFRHITFPLVSLLGICFVFGLACPLLAAEKCMGSYNVSTWTDCEGTLTFINGDQYTGEYSKGLKHGSGSYTYASGHTYTGEWENNEPSGEGVFTFDNGDRYVGEMLNGKRHGRGTYYFSSGTQIDGS